VGFEPTNVDDEELAPLPVFKTALLMALTCRYAAAPTPADTNTARRPVRPAHPPPEGGSFAGQYWGLTWTNLASPAPK
jgi:hypothetical protein